LRVVFEGLRRYDKGMRIEEFLKVLRQALRLAGNMEADLAQLGQVLRQNPALKTGFELLAHQVAWGARLVDWGPRGYWAALLIEAAQRLRKTRGWALLWEAPWGKRLRFDRSDPGTTSRTLEEASRFLEGLLLSGELRRERPSSEEPGDEWAHRHQAVTLPGGLNPLLEAAEEVGLTSRYRPRGVVRREMEGVAALLEMGEGKDYLAALWRRVTREKVPALRAGYLRRPLPAGKVVKGGETVERRRGALPLVRALALGGYPLPLWERDEEGFRWLLPEAPGELETRAIARAIRLALLGRSALKIAYERLRAEDPATPQVLDPGGRTRAEAAKSEADPSPLERLARLALEGWYGTFGPLVFVTTYAITEDEEAVAQALAEADLSQAWGWREYGIPIGLWLREHVVHHVLVPWWRGYDPYLHQEEVNEEGEEVQGQDLPAWDGGFAQAEHRAALERAERVFGREAAEALMRLAEELPEAPFSGPVPLEEYVRWYLGL
jgi:hypothetical protein